MGQEFIIKSQNLEDKINQLLPSQGGFQAGVDLSASTTVIPIVDLTESAEGSSLREDLQKSLSHTSVSAFGVTNTTTTIITTTGYHRVFGNASTICGTSVGTIAFVLTDGVTDKTIWKTTTVSTSNTSSVMNPNFDFIVFINAGDSLKVTGTGTLAVATGCTRQIATISGDLVNPL